MRRANRPNRAAAYRRRELLEWLGAYGAAFVALGLLAGLWAAALMHPGWWL